MNTTENQEQLWEGKIWLGPGWGENPDHTVSQAGGTQRSRGVWGEGFVRMPCLTSETVTLRRFWNIQRKCEREENYTIDDSWVHLDKC